MRGLPTIEVIQHQSGYSNRYECRINGKSIKPTPLGGVRVKFVSPEHGIIVKTDSSSQGLVEGLIWLKVSPEHRQFFAPVLAYGPNKVTGRDPYPGSWCAQRLIEFGERFEPSARSSACALADLLARTYKIGDWRFDQFKPSKCGTLPIIHDFGIPAFDLPRIDPLFVEANEILAEARKAALEARKVPRDAKGRFLPRRKSEPAPAPAPERAERKGVILPNPPGAAELRARGWWVDDPPRQPPPRREGLPGAAWQAKRVLIPLPPSAPIRWDEPPDPAVKIRVQEKWQLPNGEIVTQLPPCPAGVRNCACMLEPRR